MKKIVFALIVTLVVIATVSSCKKAAQVIQKVFPEQTADLPEVTDTLPPLDSITLAGTTVELPLHTPFTLPVITQHFNMDSIVKVNTGNNFGAGDITSVKVKQFKLWIKAWGDSANNLSNFESANFNFSSNTKTDPTQVASVSFPNTYSLEQVVSGSGTPELRAYLDGTELYYVISASLRRHTHKNLKISLIATITMK